jgi:hypothetical protein
VSPLKEKIVTIKLYVGNLPMEMTETELKDLFTEAGNVSSAKIITDWQTGQPRGFGFVEMETKPRAKGHSMLNGRQVEGRVLAVNEPGPRLAGGGGAVGGYGGGGGGTGAASRGGGGFGKPPVAAPRRRRNSNPTPAGSTRSCRFFCE